MSVDVKYSISSTSTGGGRDGHVKSASGRIDLEVRPPVELGGNGEGTNPEELFSAGYAACYNGAIHAIARAQKLELPEGTDVTVTVGFGEDSQGGYGLSVSINTALPGWDQVQADELAQAAHQMCPYSRATRGNIEHVVTATV